LKKWEVMRTGPRLEKSYRGFCSAFLLLAVEIIGISIGAHTAWAGCNLVSGPGSAASPGTGATVVCDGTAPNPSTISINAAFGSNNVTVNVLAGSGLETNGLAINVYNNSFATNSGSISTTGLFAYGLLASGNSNSLTNGGTITTTGDGGDGIYLYGNGNIGSNAGSINVSGNSSFGLFSVGNGNTFTNSGTVSSAGTAAVAFSMNAGETGTFINQTGGVVTAAPGWYGVYSGQGGTLHVENYGLITGNIFLSGAADTLLIGTGERGSADVGAISGGRRNLYRVGAAPA
jgi:hypothetical protein